MTALSTYTPERFADLYTAPTVFDTVGFAQLNSARAAEVVYIGDGRLGAVLGRKADGRWHAPFSAPYAMVSVSGGDSACADDYRRFAERLARFADDGLSLTPPPAFYRPGDVEYWLAALAEMGCTRVDDINFHYDLNNYSAYTEHLEPAARRNTRRALSAGFTLLTDFDPGEAYDIIAAHHAALGYRMAMSRDDVLRTAPLVNADFFGVMLGDRPVAAAIYYTTAPGIAQLINWGDNLDTRHLRTANFMAHAIFGHYSGLAYRFVDLGPASVDGVHNQGLVNFKRGLGATDSPRANLSLN